MFEFVLANKPVSVTVFLSRDMHKSHFMSQRRITIPITVSQLESESVTTLPVSDQFFPEERGDELYRFIEPEYRGTYGPRTYGPFDPWSLRSEFLGWKLKEWQSFFVMAGAFGTPYITRNDFQEWQQLMRKALLVPSRDWKNLSGEFDPEKVSRLLEEKPIRFNFDVEPATAELVGMSPLDSMIASIQLDKLQQAEFRVCARADCTSAPFEVPPRHKIYCSSECAHLAAVRADRARKADSAKPIKRKTRSKTSQRRDKK
jgi:hypothetical protein